MALGSDCLDAQDDLELHCPLSTLKRPEYELRFVLLLYAYRYLTCLLLSNTINSIQLHVTCTEVRDAHYLPCI